MDYRFCMFGAGCKQVHGNCNPEHYLWRYISRQSLDTIAFLLYCSSSGLFLNKIQKTTMESWSIIKIRGHLNAVGKTQNQEMSGNQSCIKRSLSLFPDYFRYEIRTIRHWEKRYGHYQQHSRRSFMDPRMALQKTTRFVAVAEIQM